MEIQLFSSSLTNAIQSGASDLHLCEGEKPCAHIHGDLHEIADAPTPNARQMQEIFEMIAGAAAKDAFHETGEVDFAWTYQADVKEIRLRVSASRCLGKMLLVFRLLAGAIPSLETLSLPAVLKDIAESRDGLFLVTGRTGMGKSTTLAAMVESINERAKKHIVTIEDPVEYLFVSKKSKIHQREIGIDSPSFLAALVRSLRQDIDVIVIGELRDTAAIQAALTAAETGYFVMATLHTRGAAESVERMVDVFPQEQQPQIRLQLSMALRGVLSQQLVPSVGGQRVIACELLLVNSAVRNCIRESKIAQLKNIIHTSSSLGMMTMEHSLASLCEKGVVTRETALQHASDKKELERLLC